MEINVVPWYYWYYDTRLPPGLRKVIINDEGEKVCDTRGVD